MKILKALFRSVIFSGSIFTRASAGGMMEGDAEKKMLFNEPTFVGGSV